MPETTQPPEERTQELVNQWLNEDFFGLPITISVNRLSLAVVAAIKEAEAEAYERGYQAGKQAGGGEP